MKHLTSMIFFLALSGAQTVWSAENLEQAIHRLQQQWAVANYQTEKDAQDKVFEKLTADAEQVVETFPDAAEPLVWQAIITSSHAGATGGLGALGKVKKARKLLEAAERINPSVLHGSVYTSLGSLYYQVPGWPIGFGNKDKAESYLKKALAENATGIDPNYFYGDFLLDQKRFKESITYLERALAAPARPDRPLADQGRREEVMRDLQIARAKLTR